MELVGKVREKDHLLGQVKGGVFSQVSIAEVRLQMNLLNGSQLHQVIVVRFLRVYQILKWGLHSDL